MAKILVDTSAWINSLSRSGHLELKEIMREKTLSGELVMTGLVLLELLRGTRDEAQFESLQKKLAILPFISVDDSVWIEVALFSMGLRKKGVQVPLPDLFIAHVAMSNGCVLLHSDSDFERIARHAPLKTLSFV